MKDSSIRAPKIRKGFRGLKRLQNPRGLSLIDVRTDGGNMHAAIVGFRRQYSLDNHLMVRRGEREISRHEEVVHRESYRVLG